MLRKLLLTVSAALLCSGECVTIPSGPVRNGDINVAAWSFTGERIPGVSIRLDQRQFESRVHGSIVKDLPYGTWRIRIAAPGFNGVERVVHLDRPEVSVRTQLQVAEECGHPEPQISGTVTPPPSGRDLWVKVVPLRGIGDEEARVDPDGEFHVAARMNGDYFLLLADDKHVIYSRMLPAVAGSMQIKIGLEKPAARQSPRD